MDNTADKPLNAIADKAIDNNKRQDNSADKGLNTIINKAIDIDKKWYTKAGP